MGTDRPWYSQYAHFVGYSRGGDLGYSFQRRQPVSDIVFPAAGVTASLVPRRGGALGDDRRRRRPRGSAAARSLADRVLTIASRLDCRSRLLGGADARVSPRVSADQGKLLGISLGRRRQLAADPGLRRPARQPGRVAAPPDPPWIALAIGFAALYAALVRAFVLEQLSEEYVKTARARGRASRGSSATTWGAWSRRRS